MTRIWSTIAFVALSGIHPLRGQIDIVFEVPDSERKTIFFDDFDSDATGWPLDSDEDVKLKVDDGRYVIDRANKDGNYMLLHDGFDFGEDFTIEARMRKAKGDDDSVWFGLVWGYESDSDYCDFLVGADGTYSLNVSRQKSYTEIVGWTSHEALKTKNDWNTLRLERRAPTCTIMDHEDPLHAQLRLPLLRQRPTGHQPRRVAGFLRNIPRNPHQRRRQDRSRPHQSHTPVNISRVCNARGTTREHNRRLFSKGLSGTISCLISHM